MKPPGNEKLGYLVPEKVYGVECSNKGQALRSAAGVRTGGCYERAVRDC